MKDWKWMFPLALAGALQAGGDANIFQAHGYHYSNFRSHDFSASGTDLQYPTMELPNGPVKYTELELQSSGSGGGSCFYILTRDFHWTNVDTRIWAPDQAGNYISLDDDGARDPNNMNNNYYASNALVWINGGTAYRRKIRVAMFAPDGNLSSFSVQVITYRAESEAVCVVQLNGHARPMAAASYTENGVRFYRNN